MRMILIALAVAATAAPGVAKDKNRVPEATPAGKPQSCIMTSRIRASHVRNDSIIDFEMNGGQIYRNTLPQSCPGLGFDEAFSYKTSIGQLCSVDTIAVLRTGGGPVRGPTCGLGMFQPVTLAKKKR
ncbi:hypothetical protein NDN01_00315 [Sphingomonas sp. QA11]|uniref:hypothetical protein n=1 Tax=Sphingomonas sp. QA11 TaxID=2950605 RepID=UPI00234B7E55|nr:hypothetical protein [Sphingomonas sp. QA11]WCM27419.1 hypothetical protein NDN01_00315 [Sphingomonas sp. QA11]